MASARRSIDVLPGSLPPRRLSRVGSADYIGVSPSLFDAMVRDRRMPSPKRINARVVWDRLRLDLAFAALRDEDHGLDDDPFAEVAP